jgi:two-component system LytT family response regulator
MEVESVLKIAFVDDEPGGLDEIEQICRNFGKETGHPVETLPFESGEAFLKAFETGSFDLVFMDIYMEGMNGVAAALKMRRQDRGCLLVFLTSSMDFMPDAFSCHAFEYVTKPFTKERIFDVLSDAVKVLPREQSYVELTADRKTVCLFLDEIASAVTDAHYLDITLTDGRKLRCRMTMTEFMEKIGADPRFIPVNKGIAVNAEHILAFEKGCCIMESGARFPVRVRDSAKVEQKARDYHFEKIRRRQTYSADRRQGKEKG